MWYVSIFNENGMVARLKLPTTGLSVGDSSCDVQLPGLDQPVRLVPARGEIWLERVGQNGESVAAGERFELGAYTLEADNGEAASQTPPRAHTKTMTYQPGQQELSIHRYELEIAAGPDAPRTIPLDVPVLTIGKLAGCDLALTDSYVSGRHCRLALTPVGWSVNDLGSSNGTFIDDTPIKEAVWRPGVELRIGRTILHLHERSEREQVEPEEQTSFAGMVGRSEAMRQVFALIKRVAAVDTTVLIGGPTGSGKELVARALHAHGERANGPFLAVNCGAIVRELIAGELFGHKRGAFTGAVADRAGVFEIAAGGVVFLDEIGELPLELQPHLLRVLEQQKIRRIGDEREIPIDVRVITATNRDLAAEVRAGRFREDLYYRIDRINIVLPPLNERLEDLSLLAEHLLAREKSGSGRKTVPQLSSAALARLAQYSWPGNVRELSNVLARAALLIGERDTITPEDLDLRESSGVDASAPMTLAEGERELIRRTLATASTRREAAAVLGIAESTLYDKIKKYGLDKSL